MPRCSCGGTLSVPMSKPRYTAVESQLTISPLKRSASAIPSALLPVAVGPTTATRRGRVLTARGRRQKRRWRAASAPGTGRPAAHATAVSLLRSAGRRLVEVERDREETLVVGILRRERHGRV